MALDISGTVLSPIVECAYDPMKRHISYAFKCKRNVNTLKERVEALKGEQERLKHSVERERRNWKGIYTDVGEWLEKVGAIVEEEGEELELASERAEMKCFFGFCPNLMTRYRVSRKAEKKATELANLLGKRERLDPISYAAPLPCLEALPPEDYKALETRMTVSERIIKVLTTDGVSMVGVYGIGGVGKTTLAKDILRQVKAQKLFDEVVMAEVSQNVKVEDIQAKIGEALGLKFDGAESINERARRLYGRLESNPSLGDKKEKVEDKKEKVLIILDDLWKKLDLVEVGIPSKNQLSGCKIFLTSRDRNVLSNEMDCQENFEVGCLLENEAWDLFQKMAKNSFEEPDLRSTAIEVAKECAGLPLAIVTVARTLKDKRLPGWKDALCKLKNTGPSMGLTATIYSALELSYKDLESELQSIFLLCSQMGYNATTGDLVKYGIGLGLFSNVSTLEEAQNRVYSSVQRLKVLCLLLEGGSNKELVMHDVVRDVGRWIAARDYDVLVVSDENKKKEWSDADKLKTGTRIWIFGSVDEVPEEMDCPNLVLAHVDGKDGSLTVPDNLFKGLHKLKVLSFTSFTFSSLPSSLRLLQNLKTLCFHQSMELEGVGIIGKLTKLEVLSFAESNITHLPVQIGRLTELRLLDLSGCWNLQMIPPNILSRLTKLEELYMGNSFDRWTVEGEETQDNASLRELKELVSLTNLEISILDARLVSEDIFPEKLCRYKIFIGSIKDWNRKFETLTKLKLKLNANLQIEKGLMRLVKKTEDLYLDGLGGVKNFVYDLDNDGFPKLEHLHLRDSPKVQYFADMTRMAPIVAFPVLKTLYLKNLISLEKIYQSRVTGQCFFSKLRIINVKSCGRLTHLFLFSVAKGLSQLQEIEVDSCASLETVVAEASEAYSNSCDATDVIEFSQLESLILKYLPKLTSFCSDANPNGLSGRATNLLETNVNEDVKISMSFLNHKILLPNLKKMDLYWIDNMETLWHGPAIKNSFQNLTDLTVWHCNSLKYVFSYSLIKCLGQLQSLYLTDCSTLEEVILVEEESGEEQLRSSKAVLLPKLQYIDIDDLPELKRFCKGYLVECPLLKELSISECPQLKTFVSQECEQVRLDVEKNDQTAKLRKPLFDEMVVFPSLEMIYLGGMISIEKIWHNQLAPGSFCKLKQLNIYECVKLAEIFPPILILLERFQKLESLDISYCDCVEEIFGVEGSNNAEHISFQLRHLSLWSLPKLRHIWTEDSSRLLTFPNLCKVKIEDCTSLRHVFPRPIAENLFELEELAVGRVDEIVATAENGEDAEVHPLMWPNLKMLDIPDPFSLLQKVSNINSNLEELAFDGKDTSPSQILKDHVHFSKLKVVNLHHFMDERTAGGIPFGFLQKLPNLETLCVTDSSFRELFSCDGVVADSRVLSCLKHLSLKSLDSLRHIWEQNDFILASPLLQNIETLRVEKCDSLVTLTPSSASFKNLTTLSVSHCSRSLSLVTASMAKSLGQLINFEIKYCEMMTEIIDREGDEADNIIFTKLQCLKIVDLPSLTSFCSGDHTFSFPSLKEMIVRKCPKMRVFCAGHISTPKLHEVYLGEYIWESNKQWEGNLNSTIQKLYIEKVGFDGMHDLKLSEFPELKELWHGPLPGKLFSSLWSLVVDDCSFFSSAVPSNLLPSLGTLRNLCVRNCDSLEEVFDLERLNADEDHVELLPKLDKLCLSDLPRLLNIWNKNSPIVLELKCLTRLEIHKCPSLQNIFTPSMAVCLVRLKEIKIRNCTALEEIYTEEKAGEATTDQTNEVYSNSCDATNVIEFFQLESLRLTKLPKLTSICSDANPSGLSRRPTNLLETNINEDVKVSMTLLDHKILLPNLKRMYLSSIDNMETLWQLPPIKNSFQNLTYLTVRKCHRLKYVFSYSLIKCLGQLQRLDLRFCDTLEEVILVEEEQLRSSTAVLLPKLQSIYIRNLPELKRFCKGYLVDCPLLTRLWILNCPQLKTFVSQECEQVRLDVEKNDQTAKLRKPLFDEMVFFPSLADLDLWDLISIEKIWHNQLAPGSFCQLENLEINGCKKLADIFPPILILLERFQKLESLDISNCDCVEEIFGVEGSNNAEHISFQLKRLDLKRLAKLRHIWTEDSSRLFTFPNLCKVKIEDCTSLRHVFPRPIAENLLELEELTVRTSRVDEIVATAENGEEAKVHPLMWPKLKMLDIPDPLSLLQKINSNLEFKMDQAVPMSNQAESSKQPNLNSEDAQQQNSGTCDVPEGQTRKAIHVNENPDAVEELFNDIGATNTITTKQQSLEAKDDPTLNQNSPTPLDIKDDIVLHPQVDPHATDEDKPIPLPLYEQISNDLVRPAATEVASLSFSTSTTKTAYSQMGKNISTSEDSHVTKNLDYRKDLFPEIEPTKNIRAKEHADNGSLVELVKTEMAMTYLYSPTISNDQDQAVAKSVHQSSMTQPNIDHVETDEPRDIKTFEVSEWSTSDELHTSKNLNESNSLEIVEEGIVTCSDAGPEMTQIAPARQVFHFTVDEKEATPDQGARVALGVVTPLPASEMSHLSHDNYLKCIRTPDDHFMDSSFAQNAIELFEWKINADRDHPVVYFLAELVADLKQLHTSEENLSLGANPPMRTNEHENTLGKCIEELNEVDEKIQEYEKVLGDLKKQRQKLLQRRTSLFEQMKKRKKLFEAVKIDLCEARSYSR